MIKSTNALVALFVEGTAASGEKFTDLVQSSYNKIDDALLYGPIGQTGQVGLLDPSGNSTYGLLGPSGSTAAYYGLFFASGATPSGPTATGVKGSVIEEVSEGNIYLAIDNNVWIKITGATSTF